MFFHTFWENLRQFGLARAAQRFYGPMRAYCKDNRDPEKRGRIRILCPQVGHSTMLDNWVLPSAQGAGAGRGLFYPPEIDDVVWVFFREGDPNVPEMYLGGWFGAPNDESDVPKGCGYSASGYPDRKGLVTRTGGGFLFNDEKGQESIAMVWHQAATDDPAYANVGADPVDARAKTADITTGKRSIAAFDSNGGYTIVTPTGHMISIDEANGTVSIAQVTGSSSNSINLLKSGKISVLHRSGSNIELSDSSINISADPSQNMNVNVSGATVNVNAGGVNLGAQATISSVLGEALLAYINSHIHGTGVGPSSPPVVPATPALLSKSVKLQP